MSTSHPTPTRRHLLGLLASGLALVAGGRLATPVAANQSGQTVNANGFIDFCFRSGGEPTVVDGFKNGMVIIYCDGLSGVGDQTRSCAFRGDAEFCWWSGLPVDSLSNELPMFEQVPTGELSPLAAAAEAEALEHMPAKKRKRRDKRTKQKRRR